MRPQIQHFALIILLGILCCVPGISFALGLQSYSHNRNTIGRYHKYEGTFSLDDDFSNPFDANIIAIDAIITVPDGNERVVPAFICRFYKVIDTVPDSYRNPGDWMWKIRFTPRQVGSYRVALRVVENGAVVTDWGQVAVFTCVDSDAKGMVRRDPNDVLCLQYDDDSPRINIGHNVCWTGDGLPGFKKYFTHMHAGGENWSRLWMTHFYNGTILEWRPNGSGYFDGLGRYSQQVAQRLDGIIEAAEANGIAIQLVLQHHGQFSTTTNSNWDENPYNAANGGMLKAPEEFFTNPEARRLTRNKYRYIVARWGYSPAILAWELWNEVQFTDGWRKAPQTVVTWHREMADYLHRIDPYPHLITTSSDTGEDFAPIWDLNNIDVVQLHQYGNPQIESYRDALVSLQHKYAKPVILGEFGIGQNTPENNPYGQSEPRRSQILVGLVMRLGAWASAMVKSSGHLWWWDSYIEPHDLYPVFKPLHLFMSDESLSGMTTAPRVVSGAQSQIARPLLDQFWGISTQTEFWSDGVSFPGMDRLCVYLHGSSKPDYRSDPIFHLTMPMDGQLVINIDTVSGWGNNRLRVRVNGHVALTQSLVNNATDVSITVPLQAGEQTVQIENIGQDWAKISSYAFQPDQIGKTNSLGLMNHERALLWIYDEDHQYGHVGHGVIEGEVITVPGLQNGLYDVTVWDTQNQGGVLEQDHVTCVDQVLKFTLPAFSGDIAVKIKALATP